MNAPIISTAGETRIDAVLQPFAEAPEGDEASAMIAERGLAIATDAAMKEAELDGEHTIVNRLLADRQLRRQEVDEKKSLSLERRQQPPEAHEAEVRLGDAAAEHATKRHADRVERRSQLGKRVAIARGCVKGSVATLAGKGPGDFRLRPVTLPKDANRVSQRVILDGLASERERLANEPIIRSSDEVLALVDRVAELGKPRLAGLRGRGQLAIVWPRQRDGTPDVALIAGWGFQDRIKETLLGQFEEAPKGLGSEDRRRQLSEMDSKIDEQQRVLAELIWRDYASTGQLELEPDLHPLALLGVEPNL